MPSINPALFERLRRALGVSQARVYQLIDETVRTTHLPRYLAAIVLASERGINISKFASLENLAEIRYAGRPTPSPVSAPTSLPPRISRKKPRIAKPSPKRDSTVFVVHGRDLKAREAIFAFLRAIGLKPLEWAHAIKLTHEASPYVGTILEKAFQHAAAIVVLLTPDDEARLRRKFLKPKDPIHEKTLTGQARANVLFEAGMAFGRDSKSTVLVQIGELRPFSDIGGRHIVHLSNEARSRNELATKLTIAGCEVDISGEDWLKAGDFS